MLALGLFLANPLQAQNVVGGPYSAGYAYDFQPTITTLSWSHTILNAEGRLLVVSVVTPLGNVTSVTFNGLPLTQKAMAVNDVVDPTVNATGVQAEIWYLVDPPPPVGTYNIVVSLLTPVAAIGGIGAQYRDVDQTNPLGSAVATVAGPPATSVSSNVLNTVSTFNRRGMVIDAVGVERQAPVSGWSAGPDQTRRGFQTISGGMAMAISEESSNGATVTMSGASDPAVVEYAIAHVAVEVRPAPKNAIWISASEIGALPTSGASWDTLNVWANKTMTQQNGPPTLAEQDDNDNMVVLAKALRYVRLGNSADRDSVRWACNQIIGTEECRDASAACGLSANSAPCQGAGPESARTLSVGRELGAYVIALDLVGGPAPADSAAFNSWLRTMPHKLIPCDGCVSGGQPCTMFGTARARPNNWGTMNMGSLAAVFTYLGWTGPNSALDSLAWVVEGFAGNRAKHVFTGFNTCTNPPACDDLTCGTGTNCAQTWMPVSAWPTAARPINPADSTRFCNGNRNIAGAIPDDHRRGGAFTWPPCWTRYPWGGLAGLYMAAWILYRQGYAAFDWGDQALKRAVAYQWYLDGQFPDPAPPGGYERWWCDHEDGWWVTWINRKAYGYLNYRYPTKAHTPPAPAKGPGKNMSFTDWTHAP